MGEFKAITTQEEFDEAIKDRLLRQKESIEKEYADYAELKTRNQELETELGTLQESLSERDEKIKGYDSNISELNAKIAEHETVNLRTKIALDNGIPIDLASRLIGDDEESIAADAKRLAELVGNQGQVTVPPLKNTEPPLGDGQDGAYKSLLENLNLEGE